ncbi:glycerol_uptake_protein_-_putative [Leishmania infantum]|nr:glycerol_uptake_protein_-_putative [Leishmania infantum]SUZ41239.1 glycerol_uptake_protein_-_putative [Leishmania infantum]
MEHTPTSASGGAGRFVSTSPVALSAGSSVHAAPRQPLTSRAGSLTEGGLSKPLGSIQVLVSERVSLPASLSCAALGSLQTSSAAEEAFVSCSSLPAVAAKSPSAQRSPPWKCGRLYFVSPTTALDVGAADYNTVYPRCCSLEYLAGLAVAAYIILYGFAAIRDFCDRHAKYYWIKLVYPTPLFLRLGTNGYDNLTDKQWTGFCGQYPKLLGVALLLGAWSALCRDSRASSPPSSSSSPLSAFTTGKQRADVGDRRPPGTPLASVYQLCSHAALTLAERVILYRSSCIPAFYTVVGVVFVIFVHGPHFFLPLLIIIANYVIFSRLQRWCPYWLFMVIMWAAHVTLLYLIEINDGFEQTYWLQYFVPTSEKVAWAVLAEVRIPLWKQRMRWCVAFRMSTLRLIAFNYDLWEATHAAARARDRARAKHDTGCVECAQLREQNAASAAALPAEALRCYKYRTEYARDPADYNFLNYAAYVLFPPLYLAGPMSSFNAFVSHMRVPSTSMPLRKMVRYAFGILRIYITEYTLLHFVHIPCLGSYAFVILRMTLLEQAHFLFYMLAYLWLKFSFIWKSSRLFAMFSGIEVPEDMRRCFGNTLTVRGFWRDWHASFNLWIVRYMYIPMGGRSRVALSVLPIFLFIAVWHDPALHLVKWAVCIAAMFVAEVAVSGCFGWAAAAFRREMAAAAPTGAVSDAALENGRPTNCAPRRSLLARLARLSARRLSPRTRAWLHRQIRVVGGMSTVFALIVANLIGFSMQNSSATIAKIGTTLEPTDAEDIIARSFSQLTPWFATGLLVSLYTLSSLAVIDRDMQAHMMSWLRQQYKLNKRTSGATPVEGRT